MLILIHLFFRCSGLPFGTRVCSSAIEFAYVVLELHVACYPSRYSAAAGAIECLGKEQGDGARGTACCRRRCEGWIDIMRLCQRENVVPDMMWVVL